MSSHAEPEARPSPEEIRRDIEALPSDWRLCRVGPDKAPIGGKGWYDNDRHTPDEAASLNGAMPPAWGLLCGEASGALVLDLDAPGWRESFEEVTGHPVEALPPTIVWTSGKPGRSGHAFTVPIEWWPTLRNRAHWTRPWREGDPLGKDGKQPAATTTWELRWTGHQSVILGAHPETGRYRWLPGCSPHDIPDPAEAPEWLLELLLIQEHPQSAPVEPTAEDAARAAAMLQCIPAADHSSYSEWLRVGMALHHTDPGLLTAWVDWCRPMATFNEAECLAKWESFGKGHKGQAATIATLHYLAKQHGYKEPKRQRKATRTAKAPKGQGGAKPEGRRVVNHDDRETWRFLGGKDSDWLPLVEQHVFGNDRWLHIEGILHRWAGSHYEPLPDQALAPGVAPFLRKLVTTSERPNGDEPIHHWAKPARVTEAIDWFRKTLTPCTDFNPSNTLNCRNGVLTWTWDGPRMVLAFGPHDPAQHFTYCLPYN